MREFLTGTEYEELATSSIVQFQNVGNGTLIVTRAASKPAATTPGWVYLPGAGERGTVADLFPAQTGTLWGRSDESTFVLVEESS